jgi:hypothetical protein
VFAFPAIELAHAIQPLRADTIVAAVTLRAPAEFTVLTAAGLRQLLRDHPEERVVIEEEFDSYMLRLVPPLVRVGHASKLFRTLKSTHPGGLHIFGKDTVDHMATGFDPEDVVGDLMTKDQRWSPEDVTAATLLDWSRNSSGLVRAWEQDHSWYMLEFNAFAEQPAPLSVVVFHNSILIPELQRLQRQYWTQS